MAINVNITNVLKKISNTSEIICFNIDKKGFYASILTTPKNKH